MEQEKVILTKEEWDEISRRIGLLEKKVFSNLGGKMPLRCDNCGRPSKFQTGKNKEGKIGTWCSEKCCKEYFGEDDN